MIDWRGLCAELLSMEQLDWEECEKIKAKAAGALAQPEPAGPTDEELDELWADIDGGGAIWAWQPYARAVLKRWGR